MKISVCLLLILTFSICVTAQMDKNRGNSRPLAQNFTASSLNGEPLELSQMKGKVVLLTFWSTKCAICVSEIPQLNKISAEYSDKGVVFLGLAVQNEQALKKFLRKKPFHFKILPNSFGVILKYADRDRQGRISMGFPSHYLINQQGEIVLKMSGFDKTEKLVRTIDRLLVSQTARVE